MYTIPVPEEKISQDTRKRIGEAIYLLAHLIRSANWKTGRLVTTHQKIATLTGFPQSTVKRWMQTLSDAGEITTSRVPNGTLVTINDYQPIARTRRVEYRPPSGAMRNRPPAIPRPSPEGPEADPDRPDVDLQDAGNGISHGPLMDLRRTAGGLSNIKRILDQVRVPSTSQNVPPHSGDDPEAPACGLRDQTRADLFDYSDPWEAKLALTQEELDEMPEQDRRTIELKAMEEMENDRRPFIRIFVTRDESGRLIPRGRLAGEMILRRIAEMIERDAPRVVCRPGPAGALPGKGCDA